MNKDDAERELAEAAEADTNKVVRLKRRMDKLFTALYGDQRVYEESGGLPDEPKEER